MRVGGNKYGARKTVVDGIRFDSKREAERWCELCIMANAGDIQSLQRQVRFEILPKTDKYRARYYVADFVYRRNGQLIVEDSKGARTDIYKLKRAMFYQRYGIEIREV